ncbi:MAG: NAD(P)/FAD-dependent oxidoreductase [Solirubrobacterales bacterium]|nr:NAD(P)/FAD-dependent oxidoreductase [Solirubrobacterales bacterium]
MTDHYLDNAEWQAAIADALERPDSEPMFNLRDDGDVVYDAIWVGGGAAGRFGSAYLRAMGKRPLVIDRWPFLGGSCPHQACVPHHLFSEAAALLDRSRWFSGELFFPEFDESRASILDLVKLFRAGRGSAHAFMNWQTQSQLEVEFILNATAEVVDRNTVRAAGRTFTAENLVLGIGAYQKPLTCPGAELPGVLDWATLVEDLDEEPTRCVIIGGGKVAVEYGSFFQATGCHTTIVSRSPILRTPSLHHVDEGIRRYLLEGMRLRGMTLMEGTSLIAVEGDDRVTGARVRDPDGREITLECDLVFNATGERANSDAVVAALGLQTGSAGEILVDSRMRTNVEGVYAVGDLIGPPMEMFKARKCGMAAARNIAGEPWEFDFSEYPDFLHSTYEVTWVGLSEEEARERYDDVTVIQMPPKGIEHEIPLPCAEGTMLYAFARPELTGLLKCVIDGESRRVLGFHHIGYGAKDAFQYLDYLLRRPEGLTIDELGEMNELFLNPEHFIQLSRLRAGRRELVDL